jgi:hypothetical protein
VPVVVLLVALAAAPAPTPDVHVTARTAAGTDAAELARAIGRALVATGATVVMGSDASEPCRGARCVRLAVQEERPGRFRVEARHPGHFAAAAVEVPPEATVFERARAIAVQARLLIDWPLEDPSPAPAAPPPRRPLPPAPVLAAPAPAVELLPAVAPPVESQPPPPPAEPPAPIVAPVGRPPAALAAAVARPVEPTHAPTWAWISTLTGAGAGVAAGVCALIANDRYQALSDRSIPLADARRVRDQGKRFQTAGLVLGGVAVAGLGAGAAGFWLGGTALPEGGGTLAIAGSLP